MNEPTSEYKGQHVKRKIVVSLTTFFTIFWLVPGVFANDFDHSKFDQVLKSYVDEKGLVDYSGIAKDKQFSEYMQSLQGARVEKLSRNGQLAFWINGYNAVTIDKVIKKKPKKSVRETFVPGVWTATKFFTSREHIVAGKRLSQDDIEHEILRKQFKDPRIHFCHHLCFQGLPAAAESCLHRGKCPNEVGGRN